MNEPAASTDDAEAGHPDPRVQLRATPTGRCFACDPVGNLVPLPRRGDRP